MSRIKVLAIVLIVAGILGVGEPVVHQPQESHDLKIGSLEVSVKDKETVNIPMWCSVGAIAVGALLLLGRKKG